MGDQEIRVMTETVVRGRLWPLLGLAGMLALSACKGDAKAEAKAGTGATTPPVVLGAENLAIVQSDTLESGPTLSGELSPENSAQVRAEVAGPVLQVYAEQGQAVKRGEVLARIDDTALREALLSARAGVRSAQTNAQLAGRNAERSQRLEQAGAVAERDLEQAQLAATSAQGSLADARSRLVAAEKQAEKATVRAPFSGVVAEQAANSGDVVQSGALLYTIVDPASMRLEASVPANEVPALRVGMPVSFTVTGYEGKSFEGKVTRISPAADPATRQVRITVAIPNAGRSLVAGLYAQGRVAVASRSALALATSAVDQRGIAPTVLRLRNARVERVAVQLGVQDEVRELVEVRNGLAAGDTVLLGSAQGLTEGTTVRVRRDEMGAKAGKQ
jgi:RND family efflux transporter MFP subunit